MKLLPAIIVVLLFLSCSGKKENPADIFILGNITGVPDGYVYLVEAKNWKAPLDSALISNGRFEFHISPGSSFTPFPVALHFLKNNDALHPVRLQFRNHTLTDSLTSLRDVFWLERGTTTIEGSNPLLRIHAGKETELLYKHQHADIGWMGDADTAARNHKLLRLQTTLKDNAASFFLLQSIADAKHTYHKEELTKLFSLFDTAVQYSEPGKKFLQYLSLRPDANKPYPALLLKSAAGAFHPFIDTTAKLNMLVFWASWCTPCIKEVPQLKELHRRFSLKGLHIVSISIDENETAWQQGLRLHNMPWQQLLVQKEKIEEVQNIFSFTTIPFLIFTDGSGKELARFSDYDPDNTRKYEKFILRHIK